MGNINLLIAINASTLITIITLGVKFVKFIDRMEFRTDLMWEDYQRRMDKLVLGRRGTSREES